MENASLVGLSRRIALQRELDVVANNVANLNTGGYKADNVVFHEHLMPVARANQFRGADRQLSFVQDRATWLDLSQGPVQQTGNPLDVALNDSAFLELSRGAQYRSHRLIGVERADDRDCEAVVANEWFDRLKYDRYVLNDDRPNAFGGEARGQVLRIK